MKAIIKVDVPEFQVGQSVDVYFRDTMCIKGVCEKEDERTTGKWEWYKESPTYMRCSACGEAEFRKTKYCPNFGAKMEGAEE